MRRTKPTIINRMFKQWHHNFKVSNQKAAEEIVGFLYTSKKLFMLFFILVMSACNSENAPDCLQNAGDLVRVEVSLSTFTKITVFEQVALVLKQGDIQKVEIETGEFLLEEVTATVEEGTLVLRNENGCNLFRNYGLTTVYVTAPNITALRSSTGLIISSDGILNYPNLALLSESFTVPEAETTDGEFDLELNSESVSVTVNGLSYVKLRGITQSLSLNIAAGDSRIEAENLIAQRVTINHRGSNAMQVNPQEALSGVIRATGNVVSFNRPAVVDVEEIFDGRLIFIE